MPFLGSLLVLILTLNWDHQKRWKCNVLCLLIYQHPPTQHNCLKSCGNSRLHSRIARRVTRDNVKESNFSFNSIFFTYTFHLFTKKKVWLLYINPWIHYFISWNHIFISQAVHYIKQTVYWVILFIQSSVEVVNIK